MKLNAILAALIVSVSGLSAQQLINVGTTPNDGTGDTVRAGFIKVNENFTEVYTNHPGNVTIGGDLTVAGSGGLKVSRVLAPNTAVTGDGTNFVCNLAVATNFRIISTGDVHIILSNIVDGASGRITVYADGTARNVSASASYMTADAEQLSQSVTNQASYGYYVDDLAVFIGGTWFE